MSEAKIHRSFWGEAALDYLDALYGFAVVLTHDPNHAEDLVQETYLRAAVASGRLVPDSNLKGWLFVIMRNVWLNEIRHERNGPEFVDIDDKDISSARFGDAGANNPQVNLLRKVEREHVRAAIDRLPRAHREVIVLRDIEGFSYRQIATIIGCPEGTVMSRLARARDKLRTLLGRWNAEPLSRSKTTNRL